MRPRRSRGDEGAAAVEFALVTPLLFLLMFGILQYGLYFFDTLGTRNGVREAARQGVVQSFPGCGSNQWSCLKANVSDQVEAVTGETYVKIQAPSGWVRGKPLLVCAIVASDGGLGLLPMPDGGLIQSKTMMSIEVDDTIPSGFVVAGLADTPPAGSSWSWCA